MWILRIHVTLNMWVFVVWFPWFWSCRSASINRFMITFLDETMLIGRATITGGIFVFKKSSWVCHLDIRWMDLKVFFTISKLYRLMNVSTCWIWSSYPLTMRLFTISGNYARLTLYCGIRQIWFAYVKCIFFQQQCPPSLFHPHHKENEVNDALRSPHAKGFTD